MKVIQTWADWKIIVPDGHYVVALEIKKDELLGTSGQCLFDIS